MTQSQSNRPQQITPERLQELLTTAVTEGNRPLMTHTHTHGSRASAEKRYLRAGGVTAEYVEDVRRVGAGVEELFRLGTRRTLTGKSSELEKQLKILSAALSSWHLQQQRGRSTP